MVSGHLDLKRQELAGLVAEPLRAMLRHVEHQRHRVGGFAHHALDAQRCELGLFGHHRREYQVLVTSIKHFILPPAEQ